MSSFFRRAALFRLKLKNLTSSALPVTVSADLDGFIARYDSGWAFRFPRPDDPAILRRLWPRAAGRGTMTHTMLGSVFTELIISAFFGFQPDWQGKRVLVNPALPPGFAGKLSRLPYRGKLYDVGAGPAGVSIKPL